MKQKQFGLKKFFSVIFSIVIFVFTIAMVSLAYYSEYTSVEKAYINSLVNTNESIDRQIFEIYEEQFSNLKFLSSSNNIIDNIENNQFDSISKELLNFKNSYEKYSQVTLSSMGKEPRILASADTSLIGKSWESLGWEEGIGEILNGNLFKGKLEKSKNDGKAVELFHFPIKSQNRIIGILSLSILVEEHFLPLVKNIKIGKTGYAFVINSEALTIAHPTDSRILLDRKKADWYIKIIDQQKKNIHTPIYYTYKPTSGVQKGKSLEKVMTYVYNQKYKYFVMATLNLSDITDTARDAAVKMLIVGVLCLFVTIGLMYIILQKTLKPLTACTEIIVSMSEGDLKKVYEGKIPGNEIGKIIESVIKFQSKIKEILNDILSKSSQLAASSEEIASATNNFSNNSQTQAATIEEITATIEEVSAGMENVSSNAKMQFDQMTSLKLKQDDLSNAISDTVETTSKTLSLTETIEKKAHSGEESLNEMNQNMKNITDSSQDMINIVKIINEISEKINLLSLNAAIEAARAGDAGRGFAVVSDEISKLADQTAQSIKEINVLITSNNEEINKGINNIEDIVGILSSVIGGVEEINGMMDQISNSTHVQKKINEDVNVEAETVKNQSYGIRLATEEQKTGVSEIATSISNVNEATQGNAAGAEQLSGSAEEIAGMAMDLKDKISYFRF